VSVGAHCTTMSDKAWYSSPENWNVALSKKTNSKLYMTV